MDKEKTHQLYKEIMTKVTDLQKRYKVLQAQVLSVQSDISQIKRKIQLLESELITKRHIDRNLPSPQEVQEKINNISSNIILPFTFKFYSEITQQSVDKAREEIKKLQILLDSISNNSGSQDDAEILHNVNSLTNTLTNVLMPSLRQCQEELSLLKKERSNLYRTRDTEILVTKEILSVEDLGSTEETFSYLFEVLVKTYIPKNDTIESNIVVYEFRSDPYKWFKFNKNRTSKKEITDRNEADRLFLMYNNFINKNN
jgi:hypothetical protein